MLSLEFSPQLTLKPLTVDYVSDVAISVENLSKKFRIGTANSPSYHRLSEALTGLPRIAWNSVFSPRPVSGRGSGGEGPSDSLQPPVSSDQLANEFWALKDINFEVKRGEVVGIIGRNGAGKSTLLKILSRVTEPTSGRFGIRGRVASLLEVGTGFHPELTGRENIFVSGVTLGMTRAEIKKRFDEIVDFSGVEKFLDTPLKHYSSGMQVRLGFAVAAHLESEILIIDEVLAVGDAEFQSKCVGRLRHVTTSGRCVLLVSHNMISLQDLCHSAVMLEGGQVVTTGSCRSAIAEYQQTIAHTSGQTIENRRDRRGNGVARFTKIELLDESFEITNAVSCGSLVNLRVEIFVSKAIATELTVGVDDRTGARLTILSTMYDRPQKLHLEPGHHSIVFRIPRLPLVPGQYALTLFMTANESIADWVLNAANIDVIAGYFFESGRLPPEGQGSVIFDHQIVMGKESN